MQVAFFPRTGTHCIGGLVGNSTPFRQHAPRQDAMSHRKDESHSPAWHSAAGEQKQEKNPPSHGEIVEQQATDPISPSAVERFLCDSPDVVIDAP